MLPYFFMSVPDKATRFQVPGQSEQTSKQASNTITNSFLI